VSDKTVKVRMSSMPTAVKVSNGEMLSADACEQQLLQVKIDRQEKAIAGLNDQLNNASREYRHVQGALSDCLKQLKEFQEQLVRDAEGQLVGLAVDIAGKILCKEIENGNYDIDAIVTEALSHLSSRNEVVIHLNPEDLATSQLSNGQSVETDNVHFVADPGVPRAQCMLETPEGIVETAINQTLDDLADVLRQD